MLELAERLVSEKTVDAGTVELVRRRLGDALDAEPLRKFTEKPEQHALLREVLQFFTAYRPEGLLDELRREQKRDRRRLILAMLEVHGAPARAAAYEELSRAPSRAVDDEEWFFRRNLVYLVRRIPRSAEASFDDESEVVVRHCSARAPAAAGQGGRRGARAVQGRACRAGPDADALRARGHARRARGRAVRGQGSARAARSGRRDPRQAAGAPRPPRAHRARRQEAAAARRHVARLAELGGQDMSEDSETVDQLLALLKANLPFKLLGMTLRQNDQNLVRIVEALSGTPTPAVRRALEEIVSRFGGQDAGRAAQKALANFDRPKPVEPAASPEAGSGCRGGGRSYGGEPPGGPRGLRSPVSSPEPRRVVGVGSPDAARAQGRRGVRVDRTPARASSPRSAAGSSRGRRRSTNSSSDRCRGSSASSREPARQRPGRRARSFR